MTRLAALVMQLRGSLETPVWSTACKGVVRLHFKPTLIGTTSRDAFHDTTRNMDGQLNKFWGLNSTVFDVLNSFVAPFNFAWVWTFDFITFDFTNFRFICVRHPCLYNIGFYQFCMWWKFKDLNWVCKLLHKVSTDSKLGWEPFFLYHFLIEKISKLARLLKFRLDRNKIFQFFPFFWAKNHYS